MTKEENVKPSDVIAYIKEADECIERAIALSDQNYAVHKWRAIILDAKTTLEGTKSKIASLPTFKRHIEVSSAFLLDFPLYYWVSSWLHICMGSSLSLMV